MLPNCHPIEGCLLHREFGKGIAAVALTAQVFYPAPRSRIFYRTPPLPRACRIAIFVVAWSVGEERWFFRSAEEWSAMAERLKQTACPHCKAVGTLIRHGYLCGFDENNPKRKTVRSRRV